MAPPLILGWDGSPESRDALVLARCLAPLLGAEIRAIRVDESDANPESSVSETGIAVEILSGGSAARVLHDVATDDGAAMVVLGSSRRARVGMLPGGVSRRLLHGCPCPVAIAPLGLSETGLQEPLVIAVAYDGSPESGLALRLAAKLGEAAHAALRVVTVEEWGHIPAHAEPAVADARLGLQDALHAAVRELSSSLRAEPRFRKDVPVVAALLSEAELGVDLMVMGSRGYGPARSVLLGSVSEEVVAASPSPVVVVPRGAEVPARELPSGPANAAPGYK